MEESSATATPRNRRRRGKLPEEASELETESGGNITPVSIQFKPFSATPTLEDVRKELKGTTVEPLLNVVVSHPIAMTDVILDQATKMINIYSIQRWEIEAQSKQLATHEEQTSYIPGSLRTGNPIAIPDYLKGGTRFQEIEERGNTEHDLRKEAFAGIALDMTQAVVEETRTMLKTKFIKTIGIISELLIVYFEEHAVDGIEY